MTDRTEKPTVKNWKEATASSVLTEARGYDRTVIGPVLQDWIEGKPFRPEDRHRVLILSDILTRMTQDEAPQSLGMADLIAAVWGYL